MALIEMKNVFKTYGVGDGSHEALKDISLQINEGELVAIIGKSGSGKSTLLNIMGCIDKVTDGEYIIEGKNTKDFNEKSLAKGRNKLIGFVLQYFGLINSYTVYENVELPLIYAKEKKRKEKVLSMLEKLEILNKKDKLPSELSGGQNQRVAIGRALINNPKIILADEPTGALDKETSIQVMDILLKLNKDGKTVIIVTHDESIAKKCKRIIKIEDGKIKGDIRNEEKN
ncbi:MAG: ABC transporter ATP-binding protein [Clostridium sp.]